MKPRLTRMILEPEVVKRYASLRRFCPFDGHRLMVTDGIEHGRPILYCVWKCYRLYVHEADSALRPRGRDWPLGKQPPAAKKRERESRLAPVMAKILEALRQHPGLLAGVICRLVGEGSVVVSDALDLLRRRREVRKKAGEWYAVDGQAFEPAPGGCREAG